MTDKIFFSGRRSVQPSSTYPSDAVPVAGPELARTPRLFRVFGSAFLTCLVMLFGCTTTPPTVPLPMTIVTIDTPGPPAKFEVEVAADDVARDYGLMNRKHMVPNDGMIFDFRSPQQVMFWMKDTYIPLDMLFVDEDGRIVNIKHDATPFSLLPIPSAGPIRAVIEINGGRAKALGIEPGQTVHNAIFRNAR